MATSWVCPHLLPSPRPSVCLVTAVIGHPGVSPQNQAEAHYKGHKHARRLKAIEAMKNKQKVVGAAAGTPGQDSSAELAPSPVGSGELGSTGRRRGCGAGVCSRCGRGATGL